jgi:hypothetical protein
MGSGHSSRNRCAAGSGPAKLASAASTVPARRAPTFTDIWQTLARAYDRQTS